ncbi:M20 metallopeptidase family protein [Geomesophilobacter sediminis]|uniref:Amidohydrolase n=1 Tax=Geomesophilobacter sediminis TaxID=2798584 RepID=A0A8J7J5I2_9BACT|nr:M20 family metallopeptidase [Geomesophilobacter sediminis]MBJ6723716.1 amidohydrolase [Geomesophilobacter sediminis]
MKLSVQAIKKEIQRILPAVASMRQHLHTHPELALQEYATSRFIREQLTAPGIDLLPPFLETDVVAMIRGNGTDRNVTLRADIDALPIKEMTDLPYQSVADGIMHACGHDGHTAMLIGATLVLAALNEQLPGSVRCVFQPGEENVAAGKDLVAAGALDTPKPDAVLALHAWPGYPLGTISSRTGTMMAAADIFTISIRGKGGHGSRPECAVDPILTATKVISSLYELPSRRIGALEPVVITVCAIEGGSNANVIPEEVLLQGSVRYLTRETGAKLPELFEETVKFQCEAAGASYQLDYDRPYLPTINNVAVVAACREVVETHLGKERWLDLPQPSMGAEDFSYYTDRCPGAMFFLGMGEGCSQLHSNRFNFNDSALEDGILFLVMSALKILNQG